MWDFFHRSEKNAVYPSEPTCVPLFKKEIPSSFNPADDLIYKSDYQKGKPVLASQQDSEIFVQKEADRSTSIASVTQTNRSNHSRRGMMAGPVPQVQTEEALTFLLLDHLNHTSMAFFSLKESNRKKQSRKVEASQVLLRKDEENRRFTDAHLKSSPTQDSAASSVEGSTAERNQDHSSCGKMEKNTVKTRM